MENTAELLFAGEKKPVWYLAVGESWVGPFTGGEIFQRLQMHQIAWVDFIYKKGMASWTRICDTTPFKELQPHKPNVRTPPIPGDEPQPVIKKAKLREGSMPPPRKPRPWFLYYNDSQFGPFSEEEVEHYLQIGTIHDQVYAWKEDMGNWSKIKDISELKKYAKAEKTKTKTLTKTKAPTKTSIKIERRKSPRKPLVARLLVTNDVVVAPAICRDVSVGGMQVLTDQIPGPAGSRIKMNVSPTSDIRDVDPFVAEGVIVRHLEDGRGYSFRFEKLSKDARSSIEAYLSL